MATQVLLQEPRDEPQARRAGPVEVVVSDSTIINISISGSGKETHIPKGGRPFDFDVDLAELSRRSDSVRVGFRLSFGRPYTDQSCRISGEATVRLSHLNQDDGLQSLAAETTNEIAVAIFRKHFELIYLLHKSLAVEAPSPWITQEVSISSR